MAQIGESFFGEHTFAKIKAKAVRRKKFAGVAFLKTQGLRRNLRSSQLAFKRNLRILRRKLPESQTESLE
jgi:hypothetical protein